MPPIPIQIYDLLSLKLLRLLEAHNGVLLALDFSPAQAGSVESDGDACGLLLASGGRDGLIHLYDARVSAAVACHKAPPAARCGAQPLWFARNASQSMIWLALVERMHVGRSTALHSNPLPKVQRIILRWITTWLTRWTTTGRR